MRSHGTKLGQNFLKSRNTARKIAEAAQISSQDEILEVGPGKGILTEKLLARAKRVVAVEKNPALIKILRVKFINELSLGKLALVEGDILKFNPATEGLLPSRYRIVANIPYYLTSHFLRKTLESKCPPQDMTLTIQKEVAERICARPPRMNLLALSVQIFSQPKIAFKISKKEFAPAPKVDSAVININDISRAFFSANKINEQKFFKIIKSGFAQKRKVLLNNLYHQQNIKKSEIESVFEKCEVPIKARAENLEIKHWICLYKNL
ncbi:MAG: ribosomal RNA small subunit methyltransferase A [Candidatus Niyogibacteria bacterium]|nr:ribosomal RNA small subunit methyltransferase A [Candidatus Niyogibacteria bacterium]